MSLSFRNQLVLLLFLLVALALAGSFYLTRQLALGFTDSAQQSLLHGKEVFGRLMLEQQDRLFLIGQGLLGEDWLARLPASPGSTEPPPGVPPRHFVLVSDAQGALLYGGADSVAESLRAQPVFQAVLAGQRSSDWLYLPGQVIQIAGLPIANGGALFVGQAMDAGSLANLRALLDMDLAVMKDGQVWLSTEMRCSSVSKDSLHASLARHIGRKPQDFSEVSGIQAEADGLLASCFLALGVPRSHIHPAYVLLKSAEPQSMMERGLQLDLLLLGGALLGLAGLLAWLLHNKLKTLLGGLQTAVEQVERENYRFRVPRQNNEEFDLIGESFNQMIKGLEEKERLRVAMEQIVSRDLAQDLLKGDLRLDGEAKPGTVLYADIQGFSALSSGFQPAEMLEFLNNYFTRMSFCVEAHAGLIDKYLGDALLAVFGIPVPQSPRIAIQAALDMLDALDLFNLEVAEAKASRVRLGIGLSSGTLIAGNLGSAHRFHYSVLGEAVNVAERLQGLTKHYGASIVISETTHAALQASPDSTQVLLQCRELDRVQLDNTSQGMAVFEVFPRARQRAESNLPGLVKHYQEARELLARQNFQQAAEAFQALHADWPGDRPTAVLLARCRRYLADNHTYLRENPQGAYLLSTTAYT